MKGEKMKKDVYELTSSQKNIWELEHRTEEVFNRHVCHMKTSSICFFFHILRVCNIVFFKIHIFLNLSK